MDAHLVLQRAHGHAVAIAQRAVGIHQELRHDEQADALGALAAAGRLGQHQVDDVLGHVVIAGRDEDLLARDQIAAVILGFGLGAQQAQVGAAMRFRQVHRAGPVAADHLGQPGPLLFVGAMGVDGGIGAVGQALIHVEGHVGRHEHLSGGHAHRIGHALTAIFGVAIQRGPAALLDLVKGGAEALGGAHDAVLQHAPLVVAGQVQGRQDLGGQLARGLQHGLGEVGGQLVMAGQVGLRQLQHIVQHELQVADRGRIRRHGVILWAVRG